MEPTPEGEHHSRKIKGAAGRIIISSALGDSSYLNSNKEIPPKATLLDRLKESNSESINYQIAAKRLAEQRRKEIGELSKGGKNGQEIRQEELHQWEENADAWLTYYIDGEHPRDENLAYLIDVLVYPPEPGKTKAQQLNEQYFDVGVEDAVMEEKGAAQVKLFAQKMVASCTDEQGKVDISQLRKDLNYIAGSPKDPKLGLYADYPEYFVYTMACGVLSMPPGIERNLLLEEALTAANEQLLPAQANILQELAAHGDRINDTKEKEPRPHGIRYQAATNEGGRATNEDAYGTPDGWYLPVCPPGKAPVLESSLDMQVPTDTEYEKAQATYLAELIKTYTYTDANGEHQKLTAEKIEGLQGELNELIQAGKLQGVAFVADGMGGHAAGEVASSLSIVVAMNYLIENYAKEDKEELLRDAFMEADTVVGLVTSRDTSFSGMGSTLLITVTDADGYTHGAGVADSHTYRRNKTTGEVVSMFPDGSLVFDLLADGHINSVSELVNHPMRSNIFNPIAGDLEKSSIKTFGNVRLSEEEQLILCSDGVWEAIRKTKPTDTNDPQYDMKLTQYRAHRQALDDADAQFKDDIAGRAREGTPVPLSRETAALRAFGLLFAKVNIAGVQDESQLAEHLTRKKSGAEPEGVGDLSGDNPTAVIVEFGNSDSSSPEPERQSAAQEQVTSAITPGEIITLPIGERFMVSDVVNGEVVGSIIPEKTSPQQGPIKNLYEALANKALDEYEKAHPEGEQGPTGVHLPGHAEGAQEAMDQTKSGLKEVGDGVVNVNERGNMVEGLLDLDPLPSNLYNLINRQSDKPVEDILRDAGIPIPKKGKTFEMGGKSYAIEQVDAEAKTLVFIEVTPHTLSVAEFMNAANGDQEQQSSPDTQTMQEQLRVKQQEEWERIFGELSPEESVPPPPEWLTEAVLQKFSDEELLLIGIPRLDPDKLQRGDYQGNIPFNYFPDGQREWYERGLADGSFPPYEYGSWLVIDAQIKNVGREDWNTVHEKMQQKGNALIAELRALGVPENVLLQPRLPMVEELNLTAWRNVDPNIMKTEWTGTGMRNSAGERAVFIARNGLDSFPVTWKPLDDMYGRFVLAFGQGREGEVDQPSPEGGMKKDPEALLIDAQADLAKISDPEQKVKAAGEIARAMIAQGQDEDGIALFRRIAPDSEQSELLVPAQRGENAYERQARAIRYAYQRAAEHVVDALVERGEFDGAMNFLIDTKTLTVCTTPSIATMAANYAERDSRYASRLLASTEFNYDNIPNAISILVKDGKVQKAEDVVNTLSEMFPQGRQRPPYVDSMISNASVWIDAGKGKKDFSSQVDTLLEKSKQRGGDFGLIVDVDKFIKPLLWAGDFSSVQRLLAASNSVIGYAEVGKALQGIDVSRAKEYFTNAIDKAVVSTDHVGTKLTVLTKVALLQHEAGLVVDPRLMEEIAKSYQVDDARKQGELALGNHQQVIDLLLQTKSSNAIEQSLAIARRFPLRTTVSEIYAQVAEQRGLEAALAFLNEQKPPVVLEEKAIALAAIAAAS